MIREDTDKDFITKWFVCPDCRFRYTSDLKECPRCAREGKKKTTIQCRNCGEEFDGGDDKLCLACKDPRSTEDVVMEIADQMEEDIFGIKDSGGRTEFGTGAVRDAQVGKGRMDLLPARALWRVGSGISNSDCPYSYARSYEEAINKCFAAIYDYMQDFKDDDMLVCACWQALFALELNTREMENSDFVERLGEHGCIPPAGIIEVSKIFEAGAKKYEERNWEKGIPLSRFLDSGLRHLCKHRRGDEDEPHLAMAAWNFLCLLDTYLRVLDDLLPDSLLDFPVYKRIEDE